MIFAPVLDDSLAAQALTAIGDRDRATLAAVWWFVPESGHQKSDLAVLDKVAFQAWCRDRGAPLPRVFWWATANSTRASNAAVLLGEAGIVGLASDDSTGGALHAHVRRPAPVRCDHCGAPAAADARACRYCETPLGGFR